MKFIKNISIISLFILLILNYFILNSFALDKKTNQINDFKLKNTTRKFISLKDFKDAKGFIIVFTCNHCPFAKLYPSRFNDLNSRFKPLGVPLIAISSTDTIMYEEDAFSKMIKKSESEHFNFPYLFDEYQAVAKNFNAQKTPHAFVIWKSNDNWIIKYSGAIDDNGAEPEKVKNHFVSDAVEDLLNNREIKISETKSIGCQIYFRKKI